MRFLLACALVPATLSAQSVDTTVQVEVPAKAEWIGTMEYADSRGEHVAGLRLTLTFTPGGRFTGTWVSRTKASSGSIEGTLARGKATGTFTIYAGAEQADHEFGQRVISPERCRGETTFSGSLLASGILRITAKRLRADTPETRAADTHCEDLTDLRWLFQTH